MLNTNAVPKVMRTKSPLFRSVITTEAKFFAFRCTDAKCDGVSQYANSTRRIMHAWRVRKALGCKGGNATDGGREYSVEDEECSPRGIRDGGRLNPRS